MSELPKGWVWARLQDVAANEPNAMIDGPFGSNLKTSDYTTSGVRVIRLGNLGVGEFIDKDQSFISDEKYASLRKHEVFAGDLVIAALAEPVGRCVRVPKSLGRAIVKADCVRLKTAREVEADFVLNALNSPGGRARAEATAHGVGRLRVNMGEMRELTFPLAPLNEQRRIVAKIDALTEKSRQAREALDAVPELLDKLRQSILAAAFRGDLTKKWREQNPEVEPASVLLERIRKERRKKWEEAELAKFKAKGKVPQDDSWKAKYEEPKPVDPEGLPELPEGWCWASPVELAWDAGYGTSSKCDHEFDGPAVLRIPNVVGGKLNLDDLKFCRSKEHSTELEVEENDFLVIRTNGSVSLVGRAALVATAPSRPLSFASYLIRLRLLPVAAVWLAAVWPAPQLRRRVERLAGSSAGQHNISLSKLFQLAVPLPPEAELREGLQLLRERLAALEELGTVGQAEVEQLNQLDSSILAKAFRGELVPQDPNDEPASVLLDRIRAERENESTGTKGAKGRPRRTHGA